jgi:hypothetical protein
VIYPEAMAEAARAILAKHIIEAAKQGERDHARLRDGALNLGSNKSTERVPSAAVSLARARLLGVQVFFCPVGVIVMQQFTVILF